jgi:hypothetical protein
METYIICFILETTATFCTAGFEQEWLVAVVSSWIES